jgi:hypothetical protein
LIMGVYASWKSTISQSKKVACKDVVIHLSSISSG